MLASEALNHEIVRGEVTVIMLEWYRINQMALSESNQSIASYRWYKSGRLF
jgi:hypothetical protein